MSDKNKLTQRLAAALPFAHLLGLGPSGARADDCDDEEKDDDSKQRDGESDDEYAKRMEDEERKQRDDESDEEYAKRMEESDADADDGDDTETEKEHAARVKERARCAAIFGAASAGTRPDVAAHLAFSTGMAAAEAIKMLNSFAGGGPAAARSLSSRMARVQTKNPGAGAAPGAAAGGNSAAAVAAQIIAAGKKRRGEK